MRSYQRVLADASLITASPYAPGLPVWRERGLRAAQLLIDRYTSELTGLGEPFTVEHPFLLPATPYRRVFGEYTNTYGVTLPETGEMVLRPDNLQANVDLLRRRGRAGPVVAVGGLLRTLRGGATPLFRDRYMWPAVQVNQLVPQSDGQAALDAHQGALERTFAAIGLPVLSVRTEALSSYGRRCYLTVTCLPDGRPTVLSTSYLMAERYRAALGVDEDVIDVGFTGKVVALIALHHWDDRGIQLPGTITPTQVGIVAEVDDPAAWQAYARAGIRTEVSYAGHRHRAERRFCRQGVPLVLGLRRDGPVRLACRAPLRRRDSDRMPTPDALAAELAAYDRRLLDRARRRFDRGLRETGLLRGLCEVCAPAEPVFGWTTPDQLRECVHCGCIGREALVSEQGRFY